MREWIERCRHGESEAVTTLVGRFRTKALDLAGAILGDRQLAEDAVQQAFLTALRRLDDLRDPAAFPGWFRQIVRSECTAIVRRRKEQPEAEPRDIASEAASPSEQTQREDLCRLVRQALGSLPEISRQAAELFYLEERDCAEIGERLEIPVGTVKRRLYDSRERLRAILLGYIREAPAEDEDRAESSWLSFM